MHKRYGVAGIVVALVLLAAAVAVLAGQQESDRAFKANLEGDVTS